nr:hypothetical protein [Tanacetum cinerariifolium]
LGGKGRRKEKISSKEEPLPKLIRAAPYGVKYVVVLHMKHLTVLRNTPTPGDQGLPTGNQNPLESGFTKGTNLCENVSAGLPQEETQKDMAH